MPDPNYYALLVGIDKYLDNELPDGSTRQVESFRMLDGHLGYAFTKDVGRVFRLMESLEAGTIGINDGVPTATQAPFGGVKCSGIGVEFNVDGLKEYTTVQVVNVAR